MMREDERILTGSEKLAALAETFGTPPDREQRWQAWEPVLFNQAHDLSSGTMVDKVYRDTIRNYEFAKDLGSAMLRSSVETIASKIDTNNNDKSAIPVLIFNTLGWSRTDVAETEVRFADGDVKAIEIQDPNGSKEPSQTIETDRDAKGNIRHATVDFIAHDVPAMGWAIYYVVPLKAQAARELPEHRVVRSLLWSSASTKHLDSGSIENEFYRATFDLWTGAMTGLELKTNSGGKRLAAA